MKLHVPLSLRRALVSVVSVFSAAVASAAVNSYTIDTPTFNEDIFLWKPGSGFNLYIGDLMPATYVDVPFTIYVAQDVVQTYDGIWAIDLGSSQRVQGDPVLTFKPDVEGKEVCYTVKGTTIPLSATSAFNYQLVGAQQGTFAFDVDLKVISDSSKEGGWKDGYDDKGNIADTELHGIGVTDSGKLMLNQSATVEASHVKVKGGSLFYGAVTASGVADWWENAASFVTGQDLTFQNFHLGCAPEDEIAEPRGDVAVYGLFANMSYYSQSDEETEQGIENDRVRLIFAGDVCMDGANEYGHSVFSTKGTAAFTGAFASESALISLEKSLVIRHVSVQGSESGSSSFIGLRASTDADISVAGAVEITDNSVAYEGDKLYSIVVDGGRVSFENRTDVTRVVEGDMLAAAGAVYDCRGEAISEAITAIPWTVGEKIEDSEQAGSISAFFDGAASSFSGITQVGPATAEGEESAINLGFTNGAHWNMVSTNALPEGQSAQESRVTTLSGSDGHIYVGTTREEWNASAAGRGRAVSYASPMTTFTMDNLNAENMTFYLRVKLDEQSNDKIVVAGQGSGTHKLRLRGSGSQASDETSDPLVTQSEESRATFLLEGGRVDIGTETYELRPRRNEMGGVDYFLGNAGVVSPSAEAVMAFTSPSAQTSLMLRNISDLRSRLGEIRTMESDLSGTGAMVAPQPRSAFYAQALGGHDLVPGFGGHDYRSDFWGAKVGVTRKLGKRWMLGLEGNVVEGRQRLQRPTYVSKAESESFGLLLTGTWANARGSYVDVVLGLDRYEQDLNTWMLDGTPVSGSYASLSPVLSAEAGHKFRFGRGGCWFIEPQAQLIWYMAGGDDYTMSNGMKVSRDDTHSLTGRVGVAFGKQHRLRNGDALQWYVDAGVKHEFMDNPELTVNGKRYEADSLGTRVYYGVGADWWLNSRSRFYGSVQREEGGDYTSEFNARVGYSLSF